MQDDPQYENVTEAVADFFRQRLAFARAGGIASDRILLDPGLGFGKTLDHNLQLLADLDTLARIGPPILVGASRKSFLGRLLDVPDPQQRTSASVACAALAVAAGARIIRAHDVHPTVHAIRLAWETARRRLL
jgi:dihydropteroate synthase